MGTRWLLRGTVQGVGFRPWAARTARELGVRGAVRNTVDGVVLELDGDVEAFREALGRAPPPIDARVVAEEPFDGVGPGFTIDASEVEGAPRPSLPPDLATCPRCLAEMNDPADRRYGYALISCVACGPRYSLAGAPPFDRARTAMAAFPHCPACAREYDDPSDRRWHAQASACADCGPVLSMPLADAAEVVRGGGILAVKGASGFQLLCDARRDDVVSRLRILKARPDKPLAVLVAEVLGGDGPEAPIVVDVSDLALAPSVLRGAGRLGKMSPPTGVHHALVQALGFPCVCTSANRSGEPIATEARQVEGLCDAVLDHDRPIWRAADDSVVTPMAGRLRVLRRARGYAPRPLPLGRTGPPILALGADLASTVTLALDDQAWMSPHLGSLGAPSTLERLRREIDDLCTVTGSRPEALVCDAHPDLIASRVAEDLAHQWGVPLTRVHHHHAHVAAVCAELGLDEPVLGFAWDGVGLGPDGRVWGGEVLRVDGARCDRVDHLVPFALPGGDACVRDPARVALALRHGAGLPLDRSLHPQADRVWQLLDGLPRVCTSMGRLLDGLAVLAGLPARVSFEAQLPIALMEAAGPSGGPWALADAPLDWRPWVRELVARSEPLPVVARRIHATLTAALIAVAETHPGRVVLAGGCFQNRLLVEGAVDALGGRVALAERVPPGDAGISYGQAWIARRR